MRRGRVDAWGEARAQAYGPEGGTGERMRLSIVAKASARHFWVRRRREIGLRVAGANCKAVRSRNVGVLTGNSC